MIILMLITLYTSRVILQNLGVVDFGIYNVVGGFVGMFSVISGSLSSSISRYITFALGKGDYKSLHTIFCTSVNMMYILCLLLFIVFETFGIWFVNNKMVIPADRIAAANWVFQISLITFFVEIISMPYNALIISHEKMTAFAHIGIIEAVCKLSVAILIGFAPFDKLIFYALLMAAVAVGIRTLYTLYCKRHFSESKYKFIFDVPLVKEMLNFSGWSFFGIGSSMLADQGVNMLINLFAGPVVNTARGIANQISNAVNSLSGNFTTALSPQITKSYAAGDRSYYENLVFKGARFSFYLLLLLALPVLFQTPYLLQLWLGMIPEHTVIFARLTLTCALIGVLSSTLGTLLLATGKIRTYQVSVGGFRFIVLPVDYVLLKMGLQVEVVFIVSIVMEICCLMLRLYRLKVQVGFSIMAFFSKVVFRVLIVAAVAAFLPLIITPLIKYNFWGFAVQVCIVILSVVVTVWFVGITQSERVVLKAKATEAYNKLRSLYGHSDKR